jgi:hypothetical protein
VNKGDKHVIAAHKFRTGEFIDGETGEIGKGIFIPEDELVNHTVLNKNQIRAFKKTKEAKEGLVLFNNIVGGSFTFSVDNSVKELFSNDIFSDAEKVHIMFLGSFVNYNGFLMTKNNQPASKCWIFDKLKIRNKMRLYNFDNELLKQGYIIETDNRIYWNNRLCFKGATKINGVSSDKVYKTYDKTIQNLYYENQPKSLAIIFRLLPYLNKYHNVLCGDVGIRDFEECNPFSLRQVAELLGEKDFRNLKQKLLRIKLGDEFVFSIRNTGTSSTVIINPSLVWLSSYPPSSSLIGDFSIAKGKLLEEKKIQTVAY